MSLRQIAEKVTKRTREREDFALAAIEETFLTTKPLHLASTRGHRRQESLLHSDCCTNCSRGATELTRR